MKFETWGEAQALLGALRFAIGTSLTKIRTDEIIKISMKKL